jgi:hypothetical protein
LSNFAAAALLVAALTPLEVLLPVASVAPAEPAAVGLDFTEPVVAAILLAGEETTGVPEGEEASTVR